MFDADWRHEMLTAVDRYCEATGRARSGVGNLILKDVNFFDRIAGGGGCTVDTCQKVMAWLKENTPSKKRKGAPPGKIKINGQHQRAP